MYSLKVITVNVYLIEGNIPYTVCTVPDASFSLVSSCVIVSVDEDGANQFCFISRYTCGKL